VEFEFNSSSYEAHYSEPKGCDFLVCWTHDWSDIPSTLEEKLEIIPLKEALGDILLFHSGAGNLLVPVSRT